MLLVVALTPRFRRAVVAAGLATGLLLAGAAGAAAESDKAGIAALLPSELHYSRWAQGRTPPEMLRRSESRAVAAPTQYRTESVLRYTKSLGHSGMVLLVKAPLKPTKLVKFELRF